MGVVVYDTFTEAHPPVLLSAHTPDIGTGWAVGTGGLSVFTINPSGQCYQSFADGSSTPFLASPAPPTADYIVSANVLVKIGSNQAPTIVSRCIAADSTNTGYLLFWDVGSNNDNILFLFDGSGSELGQATVATVDGQTYDMSLSTIGTTIQASINGVPKITATSSAFSAAGQGGIGESVVSLGLSPFVSFSIETPATSVFYRASTLSVDMAL